MDPAQRRQTRYERETGAAKMSQQNDDPEAVVWLAEKIWQARCKLNDESGTAYSELPEAVQDVFIDKARGVLGLSSRWLATRLA